MAHRFLDGLPFWIAWWFGPVRELWKSLPEGSQATLRQYHLAVEYHISLIIWVVLKMRKIPKPLGPWVSKFAGLMTGWGGTHDLGNRHLPSGKLLHNYGKSPWLMGKSTVSMDFFLQFRYVNLPEGTSCLWEMMKFRQCVKGTILLVSSLSDVRKAYVRKNGIWSPITSFIHRVAIAFGFCHIKKMITAIFLNSKQDFSLPVKAAYLWRNYSTFIINSLFTSLFLS